MFGTTQETNTSIHSFSRTNSTTNILCPEKKKKRREIDSVVTGRAVYLSSTNWKHGHSSPHLRGLLSSFRCCLRICFSEACVESCFLFFFCLTLNLHFNVFHSSSLKRELSFLSSRLPRDRCRWKLGSLWGQIV